MRVYYAVVNVRITIHVLCHAQGNMNFSNFQWLVSQSTLNGSVPRYCYTLPQWCGQQ